MQVVLNGLIFFLMLWVLPVQAALELELTQGVSQAQPIAIPAFSGDIKVGKQQSFSEVVRRDLQNSGQFNVNATAGHASLAGDKLTMDYRYWHRKRIPHVVVGEIAAQADGNYRVAVQLVQVIGDKSVQLTRDYTVAAKDLRRLCHHISDEIYASLTGEKGVFSTRIAYINVQRAADKTQYMLEVADADGASAKPLLKSTQPIMSPRWSPDGKQIAYVSFEKTKAEVYTIDVATGQRRLMTSYPGINGAPAWSPDGKRLAIVLSKNGAPDLFLVNMINGRMSRLTHDSAINTEPSFAPDGNAILFTSNRGGSPQIYQMDLADRKIERLTFVGHYNASASYLPDGSGIVYLHREGGRDNIAIQDLASGQMQQLTDSGQDESPSIAPNGKMILFATRFGEDGVLGVVSSDGRIRLRLPAQVGDVQEPAWSPYLH